MTLLSLVSLIVPLIFSLLVIYLNNRHNRKLKELELMSSFKKHLFERKIAIIEKGFINGNMVISVISEYILIYETMLIETYAPNQLNAKFEYAKTLWDKVLLNIEASFITELYCDFNKSSTERSEQIGNELYKYQSELEELSAKRNELFEVFERTRRPEDHDQFKEAFAKERSKVKILIPLLKELKDLCLESKELLKNEMKKEAW